MHAIETHTTINAIVCCAPIAILVRIASRSSLIMATSLETLWLGGREGTLSPLESLKAYAFFKVYTEQGVPEKKVFSKVAEHVTKIGGGTPGSDAIRKFILKVEEDPRWYPGKNYGDSPGRKRILSPLARSAIKRSAEAYKEGGGEPTADVVFSRCPKATMNPETEKPVDKKIVYEIMKSECYDPGAELPWKHETRSQNSALPDDVMAKREAWALYMRDEFAKPASWWFQWVVWIDICSSILPRNERKAKVQALARKGKKGWVSPDKKQYVRNLKGKETALKQRSWGTDKVWWMPVLVRGKLHTVVLPETFNAEEPEYIDLAIGKLQGVMNVRFPGTNKPRILMSDRGGAFYNSSSGYITDEYKASCDRHGFRPLMGDDASRQSGDSQDLMLHETTVAWLRFLLKRSLPKKPWEETREAFETRLKAQTQYVNDHYDVDSLCRQFPERMEELIRRGGNRLPK